MLCSTFACIVSFVEIILLNTRGERLGTHKIPGRGCVKASIQHQPPLQALGASCSLLLPFLFHIMHVKSTDKSSHSLHCIMPLLDHLRLYAITATVWPPALPSARSPSASPWLPVVLPRIPHSPSIAQLRTCSHICHMLGSHLALGVLSLACLPACLLSCGGGDSTDSIG